MWVKGWSEFRLTSLESSAFTFWAILPTPMGSLQGIITLISSNPTGLYWEPRVPFNSLLFGNYSEDGDCNFSHDLCAQNASLWFFCFKPSTSVFLLHGHTCILEIEALRTLAIFYHWERGSRVWRPNILGSNCLWTYSTVFSRANWTPNWHFVFNFWICFF